MRWRCTWNEGGPSRVIETPLATEAAEDFVEAMNEEETVSEEERIVIVEPLGANDVPTGPGRRLRVAIDRSPTFFAEEI
jgi:hypothetical protein